MTSITIRNLDEEVECQVRIRAPANGRSMEEEARKILQAALGDGAALINLAAIRSRVAAVAGGHLDRRSATRLVCCLSSIRTDLVGMKVRVTFEPHAL